MPKTRIVVLNYDPKNPSAPFGPTPRQVQAGPNDTIHFRISPETRKAQPGCKLRITLHSGERFSQKVLEHSTGQTGSEDLAVTLRPAAAAAGVGQSGGTTVISAYKCELLDAKGQPIPGAVSDGDGGGDIVPDTAGI